MMGSAESGTLYVYIKALHGNVALLTLLSCPAKP